MSLPWGLRWPATLVGPVNPLCLGGFGARNPPGLSLGMWGPHWARTWAAAIPGQAPSGRTPRTSVNPGSRDRRAPRIPGESLGQGPVNHWPRHLSLGAAAPQPIAGRCSLGAGPFPSLRRFHSCRPVGLPLRAKVASPRHRGRETGGTAPRSSWPGPGSLWSMLDRVTAVTCVTNPSPVNSRDGGALLACRAGFS